MVEIDLGLIETITALRSLVARLLGGPEGRWPARGSVAKAGSNPVAPTTSSMTYGRLPAAGFRSHGESSTSRTVRSNAAEVNGLERQDIRASSTPCRTMVSAV